MGGEYGSIIASRWQDSGHSGSDRPLVDPKATGTFYNRGVPDFDSGHIRDGVEFARRALEWNAPIAGPFRVSETRLSGKQEKGESAYPESHHASDKQHPTIPELGAQHKCLFLFQLSVQGFR